MVRLGRPAIPRISGWLFGALALLVAPKVHAWGDEGHRVIGELAFRHLEPAARQAVQEALTDPGYQTLAEAATWPDTHARRLRELDPMKPLHYVNVAHQAAGYRRERDCPHGCVVTALEQFALLLASKDPPLSLAERRRALYWTAHLVGDIHQPLHVAHPDGRGGTATPVRFFELSDARHAHWVWDVGLIARRPPPPPAIVERIASDQPSFRALADQLALQLTPKQRQRWQRVVSAEAMARESLLVARRYAYLQSTDVVDQRYLAARWSIVAEQLQKAGLRLAALLNRALGDSKVTAPREVSSAP